MPNTKPFVAMATFCERLLIEPDGVMTAVRVVDTYFVEVQGNLPLDTVPGIEVNGVVSVKSGDVTGSHTLDLVMENPLGERKRLSPETGWPIELNGGEHGANIRLKFQIGVKNYGLLWFDVFFDGDQLLTRIPLMLRQGQQPNPTTIPVADLK